MSQIDSAAVLVARFLRTNNYSETLDAFLKEAALPPSTGVSSPGSLTIETVLDEKRIFDVTRKFEKIGVDDQEKGWSPLAPSKHTVVDTLPVSSNILHGEVQDLLHTVSEGGGETVKENVILVSTADRQINILSSTEPYRRKNLSVGPSDAPVLSCLVINERYLVSTTMSGRIAIFDTLSRTKLDERFDHKKYVVRAAKYADESGIWLATAGWDGKIFCYHVLTGALGSAAPKLGEPVAVIDLPSNPEALLFIHHPEISTPVLLVSRRDSTFLYYYGIMYETGEDAHTSAGKPRDVSFTLLGKQNLAPHSNAWIAFSPSAFAISPRDPSLLAVATSAVPHMKLIIVRLLLPPPSAPGAAPVQISADTQYQVPIAEVPTSSAGTSPAAHAVQARAALALQDREAAAINIHATTLAPQTAYSTPDLAWRPDGSGVWVNGDDGVIRGIEASTGKVVARMEGGHEAGAKIRCIWAGMVRQEGEKMEAVLSGGFDKRLVMWTPAL